MDIKALANGKNSTLKILTEVKNNAEEDSFNK
jgi:hypothetical protein